MDYRIILLKELPISGIIPVFCNLYYHIVHPSNSGMYYLTV